MSGNSNGVLRAGMEKLNQFALVIYIPDPLAGFLDELRLELVAGCRPRAHVTVLPPRPLQDVDAALEEVRSMSPEFPPVEIELGDVEVFPKTNVIYIGLRRGAEEMRAMHKAMNTGPVGFDEPYPYHPHITLAQEFSAADMPRLEALARERWQAYDGPRAFRGETLAFVQNTAGNCWLDLAEFGVGLPAPVLKLRK
jgi:2'-5' RNA ligase